ncbi:hypothetical protein BTR22_00275 [Alkalihalophilus pseudofirmus]|nr:hypothetical protein BTR22_00275 [Alkalihalophilus pseudofirmus]
MFRNVNKHLFYCIIYLIAALISGIGLLFNHNISILFVILTGVFFILSILSFSRYLMNKPKKL